MTDRVREQWIEVAEELGATIRRGPFVSSDRLFSFHAGQPAACWHPIGSKYSNALLHGLACLECNGGVWKEEGQWYGHFCCPETGDTLWCNGDGYGTQPKILLAMLRAYREGK